VFVGHGDSDKGGSFTPLSRIYDEVWVAGPAGRDRYRLADVGVRDEQVREVGRPQLAEITRAADGSPATPGLFTVLYAPTWEGFYADYSYSSLQVMGERLVRGLLALDGVRVLVKPHPASGSVDPAFATAARAVTDLVRRAGRPHQVVSGVTGLYEAFNEADMLVTDVSSVVTDFLASHKPYVMTNPHALPEADYRREFPSSGGAALWTPDLGTLADDVADARGADVRRADRERVAAYLLGADEGDPVDRFAAAVTELVGR
jgi:CDP-glycerol glycerophosphotransferase (TagB/SpsB family)